MPINKANILKGREAVETYRTAHTQLYAGGWHKGIPEEHTPLLKQMLKELELQGFTSGATSLETKASEILGSFFRASEELNIQEAAGGAELLEGMWR